MRTMQIAPGFYYHYKHDPSGEINNYAYEVLGIGSHTEKDETTPGKYVVVYRPLYESSYGNDMYAIRPYDMFVEDVQVNGVTMPRFRLITDQEVIVKLEAMRGLLYL